MKVMKSPGIWPTAKNCKFLLYAFEQLILIEFINLNKLTRQEKKKRETIIATSYSFVVYAFDKDFSPSLKLSSMFNI